MTTPQHHWTRTCGRRSWRRGLAFFLCLGIYVAHGGLALSSPARRTAERKSNRAFAEMRAKSSCTVTHPARMASLGKCGFAPLRFTPPTTGNRLKGGKRTCLRNESRMGSSAPPPRAPPTPGLHRPRPPDLHAPDTAGPERRRAKRDPTQERRRPCQWDAKWKLHAARLQYERPWPAP